MAEHEPERAAQAVEKPDVEAAQQSTILEAVAHGTQSEADEEEALPTVARVCTHVSAPEDAGAAEDVGAPEDAGAAEDVSAGAAGDADEHPLDDESLALAREAPAAPDDARAASAPHTDTPRDEMPHTVEAAGQRAEVVMDVDSLTAQLAQEYVDDGVIMTVEQLHSGPGPESLPVELQHAPREDTVCQYCGVSYLVYSEVQGLTRKVASANAELEGLRPRLQAMDALQQRLDAEGERASALALRVGELEAELAAQASIRDAEVSVAREQMIDERRKLMTATEERWRARLENEVNRGNMLASLSAAADAAVPELRAHTDALKAHMHAVRVFASSGLQQLAASAVDDVLTLHRQCEASSAVAVERLRAAHTELVRGLEAQHHTVQADRDALRARLQDTASAQDVLTARASDTDARLHDTLAALSAARAESASAMARAEELQLRATRAEAELAVNAARVQELSADSVRLASLQAELGSVRSELGTTAQHLHSTEGSRDAALERLAKADEAMAVAVQRAHETARTELAATAAERDAAQTAANEAAMRLAASEEQVTYLHATLADREAQCRLLRAQVTSLGEHLATFKASSDAAAGTSSMLHASFAQSQAELGDAVKSRDAAVAELQHTQAQLRAAEQCIQQAEAEVASAMAQRDDLVFQVVSTRGEAQAGHGRIVQLEGEVEKLTRRLAKRIANGSTAADDDDAVFGTGSAADVLAQLERQLSSAVADAQSKSTQIEHLEAIIHQECAERTFLLDEINRHRAGAHLPALSTDEVSAHARSYVSPAVQAQVAALLAASRAPGLAAAAAAAAAAPAASGAVTAANTGSYAVLAARRTSGSGAAVLGPAPPAAASTTLPSPSAGEAVVSVTLPRIGTDASSVRPAAVTREDAEWQARRAPVAVAGARASAPRPGGISSGTAGGGPHATSYSSAPAPHRQGMSAKVAGRSK